MCPSMTLIWIGPWWNFKAHIERRTLSYSNKLQQAMKWPFVNSSCDELVLDRLARTPHAVGLSCEPRHIQDAHTHTSQYLDFQPWHNDRCSSLPRLLRLRFQGLPCTYNLDEHTRFDPWRRLLPKSLLIMDRLDPRREVQGDSMKHYRRPVRRSNKTISTTTPRRPLG